MIYIDGCSYSNYYWPTWADIIQKSHPQVINLATSGSGNERIFFNLVQNLNKIQPGCKVILQWSSYPRLDYWHKPMKWESKGNRYYVDDFVERNMEWWSDDYLQFKVYHYVNLARKLLTDAGAEFYFMTMDNWHAYSTSASQQLGLNWNTIIKDPKMILHDIDTYAEEDDKYHYGAEWTQGICPDNHPTIETHIKLADFVNQYLNISINQEYVKKLEDLHQRLLTIRDVKPLQLAGAMLKSQKTNIY